MIRNVFIARNRNTGFHSLFEVIGSDNPVPATAPMDFELAEHLLRWGTLDELVTAISESGPLIDRSIYKEENRRLSINEAIEVVEESIGGERGFTRCDEDFLYLQLCLEGMSATGSASSLYPSRASVSHDIERHGLIESDGLAELEKVAGGRSRMHCRGRAPGGYRAVPKPRIVDTEADGEHQVRMRRRTREKRFQALRQNAPLPHRRGARGLLLCLAVSA